MPFVWLSVIIGVMFMLMVIMNGYECTLHLTAPDIKGLHLYGFKCRLALWLPKLNFVQYS